MRKVDLIATSTFGLEALVAQELNKLGYEELKVENGKVNFKADIDAICRANIQLRTADRIRLKIAEFTAYTFDELFEKTKIIDWAEIIPEKASFPVEGKSIKSTLFSVSDCQAIVKKAIVESLKKKYKKQWLDETGPTYKVEVAILKDIVTLTIDTSGSGLHKRGYRKQATYAPLRETLAAALILLSRWYPDTTLIDPLCGSGTIPIEAALIGCNIAPGINRDFISEKWSFIPNKDWQLAKEEAFDNIITGKDLDIIGTDIDSSALEMARINAKDAGVLDFIHFQKRALAELSSKKKYGKVICNPPYGERLGELKSIEKLYEEMGEVYKKLDTWSFYILTSNQNFEKLFGKRASKKRKLYNGRIMVNYYQYFGPKPSKSFLDKNKGENINI